MAVVCDDDLLGVIGDECAGVAEGEFMERLKEGGEGLREENHFRVIEGAEEFLELGGAGDDGEIFTTDEILGFWGEEINGIAGED